MSKQKQKDQESLALAMIKEKDTETLEKVRDFLENDFKRRKYVKLYDTYIQGTRAAINYNEDAVVHSSFHMDGAVTGRTSNSRYSAGKGKDKGVSFHTLARESEDINVRNLFVAPPGWCFITADESSMEMRVMAHVSKEQRMLEAFRQKKDLHTYSASLTFGIPEEKVTKEQRQIAKEPSFLVIYGGTEYTLASKRRIPLSRAKHVIDSWFEAFPGVKAYKSFIHDFVKKNGYVYSIFGRKRHLPNINSRDKKVVARTLNQALNFTVQSPASDILMCAILGICKDIEKHGLQDKAKFIASVHDSVELICRKEVVQEVLEIVFDNMVNIPIMREVFDLNFTIPFEIECEVGPSFGTGKPVKYSDDGLVTNLQELQTYLGTF